MNDWMQFELIGAPPLVRYMLNSQDLPKPLRKIPNILFNNIHMLGRAPSSGTLYVSGGGRDFTTEVDLRNRQFIDTAAGFKGGGCYEMEVSHVLDRLLAGRRVFYDIGANFGYFSLRAALNPAFEGTVHAFEMSPRTFEDLRRTVTNANLCSRIVGHNIGVSDTTGARPFWEDQHSGRSKVLKSLRSRSRPVSRLDDLAIPPPDVMKIDVEGHEGAVLAGATKTIGANLPAIVFESWKGSPDEARPFSVLEPMGYRFFVATISQGRVRLRALGDDGPRQRNVLAITERAIIVIEDFLRD